MIVVPLHRSGAPYRVAAKKTGAQGVLPGRFRQTTAKLAVDAGATIEQVGDYLGHESPATTKRYHATLGLPMRGGANQFVVTDGQYEALRQKREAVGASRFDIARLAHGVSPTGVQHAEAGTSPRRETRRSSRAALQERARSLERSRTSRGGAAWTRSSPAP